MPVYLDKILDRVTANELEHEPNQLRRVVLETIAACGLSVNLHNGEVYDPAERPRPRYLEDNSRRRRRR